MKKSKDGPIVQEGVYVSKCGNFLAYYEYDKNGHNVGWNKGLKGLSGPIFFAQKKFKSMIFVCPL